MLVRRYDPILYVFCRIQLPAVVVLDDLFERMRDEKFFINEITNVYHVLHSLKASDKVIYAN